jgi:hypothetical protein
MGNTGSGSSVKKLDLEIQRLFDDSKIMTSLITQTVPEELTDALWRKYKEEGMSGFHVINKSLMTRNKKGQMSWNMPVFYDKITRESFADPAFVMTIKSTCYPLNYYGKTEERTISDEDFEKAANEYEDNQNQGAKRKRVFRSKRKRVSRSNYSRK